MSTIIVEDVDCDGILNEDDYYGDMAYQITETVEYDGTSVDVIIDKPYGTSLDVLIVYHGTVEYNTEIYNAASSTLDQFF